MKQTSDKQQLWLGSADGRYFLIPEKTALTAGDYEIETAVGDQTKQVSAEALKAYEVTAQQARPYLHHATKQTQQQLTQKFREAFAQSGGMPDSAQLMELVTGALGVSLAELQQNPQILMQKLQEMLTLLPNLSGDSLGQFVAQMQNQQKEATGLEAEGLKLMQEMPGLAQLTEQWRTAVGEQIDGDQTHMEPLAQNVMDWVAKTGQENPSLLHQLEGLLHSPDKEAQQKQKRQEEYAELARKAVGEATKDFKIPLLNLDELLGSVKKGDADEEK